MNETDLKKGQAIFKAFVERLKLSDDAPKILRSIAGFRIYSVDIVKYHHGIDDQIAKIKKIKNDITIPWSALDPIIQFCLYVIKKVELHANEIEINPFFNVYLYDAPLISALNIEYKSINHFKPGYAFDDFQTVIKSSIGKTGEQLIYKLAELVGHDVELDDELRQLEANFQKYVILDRKQVAIADKFRINWM